MARRIADDKGTVQTDAGLDLYVDILKSSPRVANDDLTDDPRQSLRVCPSPCRAGEGQLLV